MPAWLQWAVNAGQTVEHFRVGACARRLPMRGRPPRYCARRCASSTRNATVTEADYLVAKDDADRADTAARAAFRLTLQPLVNQI